MRINCLRTGNYVSQSYCALCAGRSLCLRYHFGTTVPYWYSQNSTLVPLWYTLKYNRYRRCELNFDGKPL